MSTPGVDEARARELAETVREIRERVRARHPQGVTDGTHIPLPNLMPLLHARDAAEAKVAAIGSVNPRRGGLVNKLIQSGKKSIARGLNWFVRDQVQFNIQAMAATQATLEALNEVNVAFQATAGHLHTLRKQMDEQKWYLEARDDAMRNDLGSKVADAADLRTHFQQWRHGWEHKLHQNEVHYLRSLADIQAAFQHRVSLLDASQQEAGRQQLAHTASAHSRLHADFTKSMNEALSALQDRFWADLKAVRAEYEQLIHTELRLVRQRLALDHPIAAPATAPPTAEPLAVDYPRFADRFRGSEEYVRHNQEQYRSYFRGLSNVLDIGCGRGEFLEMMRAENVTAHGIDLGTESVADCRAKGLDAQVADLYQYLPSLPDASLGGIFCSQVVEHLAPERVPELVKLAASKIKPGGILAIETPNPESLVIFATHFYLDPTHTRPVPPALLRFYYEEFGFGSIEEHRFAPANESFPELNDLPESVRNRFFGALDYGLIGRKL